MPFKPLVTLVKTIRGWFQPQQASISANAIGSQSTHLISTFRRLEKRRVLAVNAFFSAGALEIEITSVGETNANLLADGTDFFVDNNNNLTYEIGEVRGAISDLQSVRAFSLESAGRFFWNGDFSLAPLAIPLGTGEVVRTEGLSEVHLQADFNAASNVNIIAIDTINFDAEMVVQGNLAAAVSPAGTIIDGANAAIHVLGNVVLQSQNGIQLANEATASWLVDGLTKAESQGNIELGFGGTWDSNTITATANNISINELNAISIQSIHATGNFQLTALGSIDDVTSANLSVDGMSSLQGTSIHLANNFGDIIKLSGSVSLKATLGSISIGDPGTVTLGDVTASGTNITLFEDADTTLASILTPGGFSATGSGTITDVLAAKIQAATMNLNAAGLIFLANDATDVVSVVGRAFLSATNRIDVESAGSVNFGSLGMVGSRAVVYEDSATHLDGTKLGLLDLHALDRVTQSGVDTGAGTTVLQIAGAVHVSLLGSPGNIDLYRASSTPPAAISDGRLLDNQIGGVFTADGIKGDFRLRNASPQAAIGLLEGTFNDLSIWHTQASIVLPNQEFHIHGDLELIAGVDVHDPIPLSLNPMDRILNGNASITDSGSRLNVSGDAHFAAAGGVTISDVLGETLVVTTGSTSIVSLGGGPIVLGQAGTAILSDLGIYSNSILDGHFGDIVVQIDSSVTLINPSMPVPDGSPLLFTANNASIEVFGDLTNVTNTQVDLGGNLVAVVTGDIRLADNLVDTIRVAGLTDLTSLSSSIELGHNGTVDLGDIILNAFNGTIVVGGLGRTELGDLVARGIDVSIQEDTAMVIRAAIASNRLFLSSDFSILNTVAFVPNGSLGISARDLGIEAGTFAHLGPISVDRLLARVFANGTLDHSGLFSLNAAADLNGQSYLDAVGKNLPPNVTPVEQLLSGETFSELKSRASFVQSFGKEYGLFVQNTKELTVEGITATGDGIHVLLETSRGTDLIVGGTVIQQFTQKDPGGMVLIAGDHLKFTPGAELRIEHISQDVSTSRAIKQPSLIASAFDAARGPAGYVSTREVLYASDAFADSGTQNVLQRVSTQFGVGGESGFQTLIRYADGSSQLFDVNQELDSSLQSNPSANSRPGVIPAYASSAGDAAVVERNSPFSDTFLGTFQTLPTSAIFRRSSEFFLFEQGGGVDASIAKVDLTPVVDLVEGVLSPGRKISFSLPTEIIVNPAILVAPFRMAPDATNSYPSIPNDIEPSGLSDAKFEVFIVKVGFDDANRDGQPSDPELPTRNEVQIDAVVSKSKASEQVESHDDRGGTKQTELRPGEPNAVTKEVKGSVAPTAAEIENWIEEYRDDPTKPSGAYAIISVDSVTGAKVLKVFGVRDFDAVDPDQSNDSNAIQENQAKPDEETPKIPQGNDKTSSASQHNPQTVVVQFESQENEQLNPLETGIVAGTMWTFSNNGGNRFGRLARSLRAIRRIQSENQNDPVS